MPRRSPTSKSCSPKTHKPDHARDMREILNEKYRNSRWAKGVK